MSGPIRAAAPVEDAPRPLDQGDFQADDGLEVEARRTKPSGAPRRLVAFAGALVVAALASPVAVAQLPELPGLPRADSPLPEEPVRQALEPVQQIVQEPLPSPVEEIVQGSPAAPLRAEVREIVGGSGGGDSPGGGSGSGSAGGRSDTAGPAAGGSEGGPGTGAAPPGGASPATEPGDDPGSPRDDGGGSRRDGAGDGPGGSADGTGGPADTSGAEPAAAEPAPGGGGTARTAELREAAATDDEDEGRVARAVDRIVEVVPPVVWAALGALALLALALGARSLIDRRRARALEGERERLLRDMGLLERVLLPQVPERLGDLAASVAYRPAAGPAAGGDFYDVFELSEGRVALLVGDVSGHGREALERSGSLRPALRAHLEAGLSPRAALQSAGRAAGVDPSGSFTTVVAALYDPASGTLTYAAAGHPPPILIGPGAHEPLTAVSAPPIGLGIRTGVRQTAVPLPRGSAACFFTDGLLEARRGGSLLGHEWLAGVVAELGPLDSAAALLDRVVEHADETPDDMTACLVRTVAGSRQAGPRIEELELEPGELRAATSERFLEACGIPGDAVATVLAEAERTCATAGGAVLRVAIDESGASASVTGPTPEVLATS
jgi:serine phosphatase RsbU (regulator of sigma subunit)